MKLHQLLAILSSVKTKTEKAKTELYHKIQKPALFQGISKTYTPNDEDGYVYPSEIKPLNESIEDTIQLFVNESIELYDLSFQQDIANCEAKADIVIDGTVIAAQVPVTYLLFLEKQATDLRTFIEKLPVRDVGTTWIDDPSRGIAVSEERHTIKTKKITDFVVAYEATEQHPAQVKEVTRDVVEGKWTTVQLNGELSPQTQKELKTRINKLYQAIVVAREEANAIEVSKRQIGKDLLSYVFGSMIA